MGKPSNGFERARRRPSFGRTKAERGLDQFDTPPTALGPLFEHEPLLAGVTTVAEPFCGKGNLVIAMRQRGFVVHASDIEYRGCPDSTVLDFLKMAERPVGCDVLVSNCAYDCIAGSALQFIEHALALRFRVIALLLKLPFLCTYERLERLHKPGHLRRVHVLAERLQDMHDANFTGEKASQSQVHAWFVLDRDYCGPATISPVSINAPDMRMPWADPSPRDVAPGSSRIGLCGQCGRPYRPRRSDSRFCSDSCRQRAHRSRLGVTSRDTELANHLCKLGERRTP
jgi:hypothetical protein